MMRVLNTVVHRDGRGQFMETWRATDFPDLPKFVQGNLSRSGAYVLRGMHYRIHGRQSKLMRCVYGSAAVACVSLSGPTRGLWQIEHLSDKNDRAVLIPPGHAAGFLALERGAIMSYMMTAYHDPADDHAIDALDPEVGIAWPRFDYTRSARDRAAPRLSQVSPEFLPR